MDCGVSSYPFQSGGLWKYQGIKRDKNKRFNKLKDKCKQKLIIWAQLQTSYIPNIWSKAATAIPVSEIYRRRVPSWKLPICSIALKKVLLDNPLVAKDKCSLEICICSMNRYILEKCYLIGEHILKKCWKKVLLKEIMNFENCPGGLFLYGSVCWESF